MRFDFSHNIHVSSGVLSEQLKVCGTWLQDPLSLYVSLDKDVLGPSSGLCYSEVRGLLQATS